MRKRTLSFLTIAALFFGANIFVSNVLSQTKPFTLEQILIAITTMNQASERDKKTYYSKILNDIRQRGVDFSLTKKNEELLRNEGATDEFIEVIRKNSPPLIVPTPTPAPNNSTPTRTPTPRPTPTPKPAYLTYLEAGDKYFNEFNFDRAIEEYTKVLELDPQNLDALIQRGYARHYKADSYFDFADYNSAIKINSNLASESSMICTLYDASKDDANNAIENCNKAISAKPNFSLFYYKRANAYREKQDYEQAITDYGKATELYEKFYSAYINRGRTFVDKEDYEKARADFSKAMEIDPKNAAAYYYHGITYEKKYNEADYYQALNDFNKAIELNPKLAGAYYSRGMLQSLYKRDQSYKRDQALFDFNKVIEIDPKFANAYFARGLIYRRKGDYNQAIIEFTKAIELDPNFANAYSERGIVYLLKEDCDRAILEFTKGIELNPSLRFAYENRGECYINKKDFDLALKDFDKLIELQPDFYRKKADDVKKIVAAANKPKNTVGGSFTGQVYDANRVPLPDVIIQFFNTSTGIRTLTTTEKNGKFIKRGLPPGKYRIKFSLTGYKNLIMENTTLYATKTTTITPNPILEKEGNPASAKPPR